MKQTKQILISGIFFFSIGTMAFPIEKIKINSYFPSAAPVFTCYSDADCNHGKCAELTGQCACSSGYIEADCSYEQKKQKTAFFLHTIFLGLIGGAADFYIEDYTAGFFKIIFFWSGATLLYASRDLHYSAAPLMGVGLLANSMIWWIAEAVRFSQNEVTDGNGKPLQGW